SGLSTITPAARSTMSNNPYTYSSQVFDNESNGTNAQDRVSNPLKSLRDILTSSLVTLVAIQIENTLLNVYKYQLLKSEAVSDMFKVPKVADGKSEEGSSPEHPIIMEGVKASDFVALLKLLSQFSTPQLKPKPYFMVPAFRLANMWGFSNLYTTLLPLAESHMSDIDEILFAKEFGIDGWLAPAHILCRRREPLTTEKARKLGTGSLLLIARMRKMSPPTRASHLPQAITALAAPAFQVPPGGTGTGNNLRCARGVKPASTTLFVIMRGTVITGTRQDPSVENKVERWVQDGFVFNDHV
ncbi:hypothetical protein FRC11_000565, partial [Ceratobasidium sp. 423]